MSVTIDAPPVLVVRPQPARLVVVRAPVLRIDRSRRVVPVVYPALPPVRVVTGPQGPPGPEGPAGSGSESTSVEVTAGATLSALRVVRIDPADGRAYYADPGTPGHAAGVLGLTVSAALPGAPVTVLTFGRVDDAGWGWDTGAAPGLYVGTNGTLTQTAPATGFTLRVGFVQAIDAVFVRIDPPIYRS